MKWLKKKIVSDSFGTRDREEERKTDGENIKTNVSETEGANNRLNDREDIGINNGINVKQNVDRITEGEVVEKKIVILLVPEMEKRKEEMVITLNYKKYNGLNDRKYVRMNDGEDVGINDGIIVDIIEGTD